MLELHSPSHAETTSRARARRGNASKRGILVSDDAWPRAIQTGLVLRGKAAQWRVDAPEMGNGETPWMYRKADGLLNRAIGAFERQAGSSGSLRHWRAFGRPKQKSSQRARRPRQRAKNPPWHRGTRAPTEGNSLTQTHWQGLGAGPAEARKTLLQPHERACVGGLRRARG